jgi:hypothetical protein
MSYAENRVTVAEFGTLPANSPLLVDVPTSPGHIQQRAHVLVAGRFVGMSVAAEKDLKFPLLVASGWRPHRWVSRQEYEQVLIQKYGSIAKGRLYLAFASPHETGLALDFSCGGLAPVSATIPVQKQTPLFAWLKEHMWEFGFTPYLVEPWHIEMRLSLEDYRTGKTTGGSIQSPAGEACEGTGVCETPHDWVSL